MRTQKISKQEHPIKNTAIVTIRILYALSKRVIFCFCICLSPNKSNSNGNSSHNNSRSGYTNNYSPINGKCRFSLYRPVMNIKEQQRTFRIACRTQIGRKSIIFICRICVYRYINCTDDKVVIPSVSPDATATMPYNE